MAEAFGEPQRLGHVGGVRGHQHRPVRGGDGESDPVLAEREVRGAQDRVGAPVIGLGQHAELVPAHPGHDVALPSGAPQATAHLGEHPVAGEVAERVRASVARSPVVTPPGVVGVTCSVGVATCEDAARIESDAQAVLLLTRFYHHKVQAAVAHTLFVNDRDPATNLGRCIDALEASLGEFRKLSELTARTYESISDVPMFAAYMQNLKFGLSAGIFADYGQTWFQGRRPNLSDGLTGFGAGFGLGSVTAALFVRKPAPSTATRSPGFRPFRIS